MCSRFFTQATKHTEYTSESTSKKKPKVTVFAILVDHSQMKAFKLTVTLPVFLLFTGIPHQPLKHLYCFRILTHTNKVFCWFFLKYPHCSSTQSQWSATSRIPFPLTIHQHWVADHTHSGFLSVHVQQLALQATARGTKHLEHRGNCSGVCTNMGQTDEFGQLSIS